MQSLCAAYQPLRQRAAWAQCGALGGQAARECGVAAAHGGFDQRQVDHVALRVAATEAVRLVADAAQQRDRRAEVAVAEGPQRARGRVAHLARINLLDLNSTSAQAYASLSRGPRAADELIARCQLWAASNYRVESPVAQMVALSGLPERSFKRRFTQATGMPPLEYIHTLRLEEAKQMLESSDLPVEAVAFEVGYQDASFFGRLFRRKVTITPAQYRRRFGALGAQLRQAAQPVK